MKQLKLVLYTILCASIMVLVSTWIPAIYQPSKKTTDTVLKDIHSAYIDIADALDIKADTMTAIVNAEDIRQQTSSLDIQKKAVKALQEVSQSGAYRLDAQMITSISAKLQSIYEAYVIQVDMKDTFQQIRTYSLIVAIIAEAGLILVGLRRKTDRK